MSPSEKRCLLVVLALALILRCAGLGWGLPGADHRFSYHPDEWQSVETAVGMIARGSLNPRFFNYPSLHPTLTMLVLWLPVGAGAPVGVWYIFARLVGVAFGVATVLLVHRLGRHLAGPRAGLLAAGLQAVFPLATVNSAFATVDGPLTCWMTASVLAATAVVGTAEEQPRNRRLLAAALLAGLAASTKYNGALALGPLLLATVLAWRRQAGPSLLVAILVAGAAFAVTSPYVLLDPAAWPQVRYELIEHPAVTSLYADAGPGWLFHLRYNLPIAAGWLPAAAALVGLVLVVRERRADAWPAIALGLLLVASLLRTAELFTRYWLPLLPLIAVSAGIALDRGLARPRLGWVLVALVLAMPLLRARAYAAMLLRPDARDAALAWLRESVPAGASIGHHGAGGTLWFWDVPLQENNGGLRTGAVPGGGLWDTRPDPAGWPADPPAWLVLNLTEAPPPPRGYREVASFRNEARLLPGWTETGAGSKLHDWNYTRPQISVLRRDQER